MEHDRAQLEDLANRFFRAAETGDAETISALYSPHITVWHSRDSAETGPDANLELLRTFWSRASELRYEVVRRYFGPDGFMQQHVLRGRLNDGGVLEIPVSFVALVDDGGRIVRIEEYCNHLLSPLRDISQHTQAEMAQ